MFKQEKKSNDHDMTARLLLFVVIIFIVTAGLVALVSKIGGGNNKLIEPVAQTEERAVIVGDNGITRATCERESGFWIECGNPCQGGEEKACIQSCEPQCLCGGVDEWQCPTDFTCTDYATLASNAKDVGVCRGGVIKPKEAKQKLSTEELDRPMREVPKDMICDSKAFICVEKSIKDEARESPLEISGSAIAFENTVNWQLMDGEKNILDEGFVTADAPDIGKPGDFTLRIFFLDEPITKSATLRLFEESAKDGEAIHEVKLPLEISTNTMKARIFLAKPNTIDCGKVEEKTFVMGKTILPVEATTRMLLKKSRVIPRETRLESIAVSNGIAKLRFSPQLDGKNTACVKQKIRAEIEATVKRFSSIKNVEISVAGKTLEETLNP